MLELKPYNEKSFVVIGNTKNYKDQLKSLGGRYNHNLSCGPGWIFSKRKQPLIEDFIRKANDNTLDNNPTKEKAENPLANARVYVGTYRKYNHGSINGAWLNLIDYPDKKSFLKAAAELHNDEADPELMFQDYEGIPSWMITESHISDEVWQQKPESPAKGEQTKQEKKDIIRKYISETDRQDYYVKHSAVLVEAQGVVFSITKPTIETRFCHDDESPDLKIWEEQVKTFPFFQKENTRGLETAIEQLEKAELGNDSCPQCIIVRYKNSCSSYIVNGLHENLIDYPDESKYIPMTEETRQALLKALRTTLSIFQKKLHAWWKKYGPEKLHVWTYWANE